MYTRRSLLRLLGGACAVGTLVPEELFALGVRTHQRLRDVPTPLGFFDVHQMHTVAAAADRILPPTETPGARDAECHRFIERIVADHYPEARQKRFLAGLVDLDQRSARADQVLFVEATEPEQDAVLTAVERDTRQAAAPGGSFWRDLKELTLIGYYTSRIGIQEELQVELYPGRFDGCAPIEGAR